MRFEEKLLFGAFEVTSYFCLGMSFYLKSMSFAIAGAFFLSITLVWFFKAAKRIGFVWSKNNRNNP